MTKIEKEMNLYDLKINSKASLENYGIQSATVIRLEKNTFQDVENFTLVLDVEREDKKSGEIVSEEMRVKLLGYSVAELNEFKKNKFKQIDIFAIPLTFVPYLDNSKRLKISIKSEKKG